MNISSKNLERFIDKRLASMVLRPGMWGTPGRLESQCDLMMEIYVDFCISSAVGPDFNMRDDFHMMARKLHPKRPSPMCLSQWFTDEKWGCQDYVGEANERERWASTQIVQFFIDWKADLKNRFGK